jgi:hypothetical protein
MPDVAATAGYNLLYFNGQPMAGGGTSFATPLWAGMVTEMDALRGTNFGFLDPALYQLGANVSASSAPYNDITSGRNCLGPAGPGWDTATGWGSPVGVLLFEHLIASFVNLAVSATPSPVAPGGAVTVVVTVTNATSGAAISGLPVVISLASTGIVGGPCSGKFGSVTPVSNRTGTAVASISVPVCYLGSGAVASILVSGHGYYGSTSASVSVNLLGFDPALAPLAVYPNNVVLFAVIMGLGIVVGAFLGRPRRAPAETSEPAPATSVPPPAPTPTPAPTTDAIAASVAVADSDVPPPAP